jgi:hypothetical protein
MGSVPSHSLDDTEVVPPVNYRFENWKRFRAPG